jgi:hypothetical protein
MQGLFYIPETKEEMKALLDEIIARNTREGSEPNKLDFMYAVELAYQLGQAQ